MKLPISDSEEWELDPQSAHPIAREHLSEEFFWDVGDDYSPCGNDDGWDVMDRYLREHTSHQPIDVTKFISGYLESMDLKLAPWPLELGGNASSQEKSLAYATASCAHRSVIGAAFAMFITHGWVDVKLRDSAIEMVARELTPEILAGWADPQERKKWMHVIEKRLSKFPTEENA